VEYRQFELNEIENYKNKSDHLKNELDKKSNEIRNIKINIKLDEIMSQEKKSGINSETFASRENPTNVNIVKKLTDVKQTTIKKSIVLLEKPLAIDDPTTKKEVKIDPNVSATNTTTTINSVQQLETAVAVQQQQQVAQQYNANAEYIITCGGYQDPNSQKPIQFLTSQPGVHPFVLSGPQQQPKSVPLVVPQQPITYVKRERKPLVIVDPTTKKEFKIDPNATVTVTSKPDSQ
jgi:hypothetical protein